MAVTKCISGNTTKNTGNATIAQAGAIPTGGKNSDLSLINLTKRNKEATRVIVAVSAAQSGNLGTIKPYVAGTFSYFDKRSFIMKVAGLSISGVSTNTLKGGNYVKQKSKNSIQTTHTGFLSGISWTANNDGQPTYTLTQAARNPDFRADDEVTTLGNLCYRTGKPLPVNGAYTTPYSH